jgi:septal ring factor EnvC (AmiA/AmiB activator)
MSKDMVVRITIMWAMIAALTSGAFAAAPPPAKEASGVSDSAAVSERVTALEKENLVLREDLGKARLETRTQLEEAAKRQAEAIARLQKQLDETNSQLQAEREKQARRNRYLWYAIGGLALGIILSN